MYPLVTPFLVRALVLILVCTGLLACTREAPGERHAESGAMNRAMHACADRQPNGESAPGAQHEWQFCVRYRLQAILADSTPLHGGTCDACMDICMQRDETLAICRDRCGNACGMTPAPDADAHAPALAATCYAARVLAHHP